MTSSSDRPVPRNRTRPKPAEDETTDPVVSAPPQPPANPAPVRRGPEPTVQLNVRIASDVSALIDHQVATTGRTKRQLIEAAIRSSYQ